MPIPPERSPRSRTPFFGPLPQTSPTALPPVRLVSDTWAGATQQKERLADTYHGFGALPQALGQWPLLSETEGPPPPGFLSSEAAKLWRRLPVPFRQQMQLPQPPAEPTPPQLMKKLKELISLTAPGIRLQAEPERPWELESLLNLANVIERLPWGQRQQIADVTFARATQPALPPGADLLDQMAQVMIAGSFDIMSRTIFLYDRGVRDGFPELSPALRQQLSQLQAASPPASVLKLQALLSPYLLRLGLPSLAEDGQWGEQMAEALSRVQLELLTRYLQGLKLDAQQAAEWDVLNALKASQRTDRTALLAGLSQRIQHLQRLPEPLIGQLLREIALGRFGDASLRFLLRDVSDAVRTTPEVARAEELLLHEMGHLFQLGSRNGSHYIRDFGKLSNWRERNGEQADGYLGGRFRSADVADVYRVLASGGAWNQGEYRSGPATEPGPASFVSAYARTDPMEDFAESHKDFVLNPLRLLKASPEKFFFLNALPEIQGNNTGVGARQKAHYQPREIEALVAQMLAERGRPDPEAVSAVIKKTFENLLDLAGPGLGLSAHVQLALVETHRPLLDKLGIAYLPAEQLHRARNPDEAVFHQIHAETLQQMTGADTDSGSFFSRFSQPDQIDRLFPAASPALQRQLQDPGFAATVLALGRIGAYAAYLNQRGYQQRQDQQASADAEAFLRKGLTQPRDLLSRQGLNAGRQTLRALGSRLYDSQARTSEAAQEFFRTLAKHPEQALSDLWPLLPEDFKELVSDPHVLKTISGDQGRYLPATASLMAMAQEILALQEFKKNLPALFKGS